MTTPQQFPTPNLNHNIGAGNVDIVIPVFGQPELVEQCVASVQNTVKNCNIFLVDDCSPGTEISKIFKNFSNCPNIFYTQTARNLGFIGSSRTGAGLGNSKYILFLNSDIEAIEPGWLEKLIPPTDDVAIVGARLLFPRTFPTILSGAVQHAGIARNRQAIPYHPYKNWPGNSPEVNQPRFVNAVTGACLLIQRRVWEELNGWDSDFGRGVYEDVDLCWRARDKGYKVYYQSEACLYHHESASVSPDHGHSLNSYTQENLKILLAKWARKMSSDEDIFYGKEKTRRWVKASDLVEKAQRAIENQNLGRASIFLEKALTISPDNTEALFKNAGVALKRGDFSTAIKNLEDCLHQSPSFWDAYLLLFDANLALNKIETSQKIIETLESIFPDHSEIKRRKLSLDTRTKTDRPERDKEKKTPEDILKKLLESEDVELAIDHYREYLDTTLIQLIHANANASRNAGQLELAEGLKYLAKYIEMLMEKAA